jgi:hypothetical protein
MYDIFRYKHRTNVNSSENKKYEVLHPLVYIWSRLVSFRRQGLLKKVCRKESKGYR